MFRRGIGRLVAITCVSGMVYATAHATIATPGDPLAGFLGRWDITITDTAGATYPAWIKVERDGKQPRLTQVAGLREVIPVPIAAMDRGDLVWKTFDIRDLIAFRARRHGDDLAGTVSIGEGAPMNWIGRRAPAWETRAPSVRKAGPPIPLFNGRDLTGWRAAYPTRVEPTRIQGSTVARMALSDGTGAVADSGWAVRDGTLRSSAPANLCSQATLYDFDLDVDFSQTAGGKGGVLLRGRYLVNFLGETGAALDERSHGGIYGFIAPSARATRPLLQWQTLAVRLIGNRVTIVMNGITVVKDRPIPGITGGAVNSDEGRPGPIMLFGNGADTTRFRKVVVTPLIRAGVAAR